jgi:hypothetical protein
VSQPENQKAVKKSQPENFAVWKDDAACGFVVALMGGVLFTPPPVGVSSVNFEASRVWLASPFSYWRRAMTTDEFEQEVDRMLGALASSGVPTAEILDVMEKRVDGLQEYLRIEDRTPSLVGQPRS